MENFILVLAFIYIAGATGVAFAIVVDLGSPVWTSEDIGFKEKLRLTFQVFAWPFYLIWYAINRNRTT